MSGNNTFVTLLVGLALLTTGCEREVPTVISPGEVASIVTRVERAIDDEEDYRRALRDNTRRGYREYLGAHPDGEFITEVRQHVANLDNGEAQARYAYEMVMRQLRATGKAPKVSHQLFGTFRPSINRTLRNLDDKLRRELERQQRDHLADLPGPYLDVLEKEIRNQSLYTTELSQQYTIYRQQILSKFPDVSFFKHPFSAMRTEHLKRADRAWRQYMDKFRKQGMEALRELQTKKPGR